MSIDYNLDNQATSSVCEAGIKLLKKLGQFSNIIGFLDIIDIFYPLPFLSKNYAIIGHYCKEIQISFSCMFLNDIWKKNYEKERKFAIYFVCNQKFYFIIV